MKRFKKILLIMVCVLITTGCFNKKLNKDLTCEKSLESGYSRTENYSFEEGVVSKLEWITASPLEEEDLDYLTELFETEKEKIKDIAACEIKNDISDEIYTETLSCNVKDMSDADIKEVFGDNIVIKSTREEIIENYNHGQGMTCE